MNRQSESENPYSSPDLQATIGSPSGALWEDNRVTVQFERVLDDYAISEWFRMQNQTVSAVGCLRSVIGVGLGAIVILAVLTSLQGTFHLGILVAALAYCFLIGLARSKRWRYRHVRRVLKQITSADAHEYLIPVRVVFSEEGFDASTQWERRLRRWSAVGRLVELGDHYLFVHGNLVTLVIPKRAFADPDESKRFLDWVQAYIPVASNS